MFFLQLFEYHCHNLETTNVGRFHAHYITPGSHKFGKGGQLRLGSHTAAICKQTK